MSSPSSPDPLEIRGLEVRYGPVRAVDGVDLTVVEGEVVALLGPSGCGKTTLLRCVAGFEPAYRGEVLIDGAVVESDRRHVPPHRRPVGLVFQDYALFPHRTVAANVAYGLGRHPWGLGGGKTGGDWGQAGASSGSSVQRTILRIQLQECELPLQSAPELDIRG